RAGDGADRVRRGAPPRPGGRPAPPHQLGRRAGRPAGVAHRGTAVARGRLRRADRRASGCGGAGCRRPSRRPAPAPQPAMTRSAAGRPSPLRLLESQARYQNRLFWRSPISPVFTLAFPLIFLVLFDLIFSGGIERPAGDVSVTQFYAPSLAVFAAASATYTNIGI